MLGIAIFMGNNGNLGAVYAGRFIAGLGIGQTAVVGPIYIAEISPASIRGICTSFFSGSVYLGIVTANFANYGCQVNMGQNTHARWLVPISVHLMFAGLIFCLSFFSYESPRYLVEKGKVEEATRVMARLRNLSMDDDYIVREISHIQLSFEQELEASKGVSFFGKIKELLTIRTNLYCLYLASVVQILGQWSGAGSVTVYATDLFQLLGVTNKNTNLLLTSLFGVVKLFAAISCAFFLIEVIGRKRSLMLGMTLQTISMIYVAAFLTAYPRVGDEGYDLPGSASNSARGAIAMIWISGIGFVLGWNTSKLTLVPCHIETSY
jgi:MFS family permease